ncbi:MAG: hypothetical protein K2J09_00695 [Muribaculaceae bacterium]|nr:hypothetical protein [Muribaculaceae bacterium]
MANTDNIKFPKSNGMTVPEGYFDDFQRRMMANLPEIAPAPVATRSKWQITRPYVYMAAMFAGIYLMMNIFSLTSGFSSQSLPEFADVVNDQTLAYVDDYISMNDIDLYDDLYEAGVSLPESL